ncbi:MAG: sigma-70 family RNA polymerase sigma factor [Nocardiopsaceae bacterium]|jgi:RNA polymerase sigma factor (sigma-70 family)|nr:sigma-70 family RNA polymerase sigma factor [Nocardiopsaceae bacterium]
MRDDASVSALVARAQAGDQPAWNELVERYAPLVWSICNRFRLRRTDIDDIGQTVWLLLVEQLGNIRQPAALPGWLATTTQRECIRVLRAAGRLDSFGSPPDEQALGDQSGAEIEQEIIEAELRAALRTAFADLPARCRQLLSMLISDPPHSYAEISATVPIAVGSIGPQRARCLEKLRRSPALAALSDTTADGSEVGDARASETGGARHA